MNFNYIENGLCFLLLFSFCQTLLITILVKSNFCDYIELRKEPY